MKTTTWLVLYKVRQKLIELYIADKQKDTRAVVDSLIKNLTKILDK